MSFDAIIKIGPIALLAGLVVMIYFYVTYREASTSAVRYFGIALLVGVLAYIGGAAIGIHAACSPPRPIWCVWRRAVSVRHRNLSLRPCMDQEGIARALTFACSGHADQGRFALVAACRRAAHATRCACADLRW